LAAARGVGLAPDGGGGALAVALGCNGRRVAGDPDTGPGEAARACAAHLACVGGEPLRRPAGLHFGSPEKPHIAWQLTESVRGLGDACRALGVPVVGGNVSLYNEGREGPIFPTPVVGMVGVLPDPARVPGMGFAREGNAVALVGPFRPVAWGSEIEKLTGGMSNQLPPVDLEVQRKALELVREAARSGRLTSIHDVSDGGLGVAL